MQQFIPVDMRDGNDFQQKFLEIVYAIYDKPMIEKPKPGPAPFPTPTVLKELYLIITKKSLSNY